MQKHFVLKCTSCGAPAADCVRLCPYCGKATGFGSIGLADGIKRMDGGGFEIADGAQVDLGASEQIRECPFCGAPAETKARFCAHCNAKIVIEKMRVARLVITRGGKLHIGGGGQLKVVGRRKRALHEAAERGELDGVRKEIEDGDDPDFPDEEGRRPIHYAAGGGHLEVAKWLVSIGADPDIEDDEGLRPIHVADETMQSFLRMMGARSPDVRPKKKKKKSGPKPGGQGRIFRHVFDAEGRRVVVGSALDQSGVELGLWCEVASERAWSIPRETLPEVQQIETNGDRSHAWLGDRDARVQIDLRNGAIGTRMQARLDAWTVASDGTIVGMQQGRLLRMSRQGDELPLWSSAHGSMRVAQLADALPGIAGLVAEDAFPARPTKLESVVRIFAHTDGGLSALRDPSTGLEWIRFAADGSIVQRLELPGCSSPIDALLDASGRLWVHVEGDDHTIVQIDPARHSADVVARSKQRRAFVGFAIDPRGELSLCRGTPEGGGESLAMVKRHDRRSLFAVPALALLAIAQCVAGVHAWVWRRPEVEEIIARGGEIVIPVRGGRSIFDAQELVEIVPALSVQLASCIVTALGFVALAPIARTQAVRAMGLALGWALLTGIVTALIYLATTSTPVGVVAISSGPMWVHGASIVALYLLLLRLRLGEGS